LKLSTTKLEREIAFMERYNLDANALLFIKALLILQDEKDEQIFIDILELFHQLDKSIEDLFKYLKDKEIILKSFKVPKTGESFNPYTIPLNKNFLKTYYKASFKLGQELFEEYPKFAIIQGNMVSLRGVAKKFDSLEDAYKAYSRKIGNNPETHNHIIELIKWAKEHNILNCTLATFIVDEKWNDLDAMKNGDNDSIINYDAVKLI